MSHLMNGNAGGATDSVPYPKPSKRNAESGSDAISPHTLAGLPAARAASATSFSSRNTLGSCGVKRSARRALPRSTTSVRSEEHTSELQSPCNLVCRLLLEKKKRINLELRQCPRSKQTARDTA